MRQGTGLRIEVQALFIGRARTRTAAGRNGYRFSVITKTIFENTNYPLSTWFQVIYLISLIEEGNFGALQIHRQIGSGRLSDCLVYVPSESALP